MLLIYKEDTRSKCNARRVDEKPSSALKFTIKKFLYKGVKCHCSIPINTLKHVHIDICSVYAGMSKTCGYGFDITTVGK